MTTMERTKGASSMRVSGRMPSSRLQKGLSRFAVSDLFWLLAFNLLAFQIYFQEEVGGFLIISMN